MRYFSIFLTIFIWITESRKAASWNYDNSLSEKSKWSYEHSTTWTGLCQTGKEQSPINIVTDTAEDGSFPAFTFTNYDTAYPASIKNNGHSVAITLNATLVPTLTGGGLTGSYVLDHFHFHWESEHTVNGYRFPLEMHLVHYSTEYGSTEEAATHPEGLAVLGVLFDLSLDDDDDFIPLTEVMEKVNQEPDTETELLRNIAAKSFLPRNVANYFRYNGSLTTPDCNEGVIWTVFTQRLPLSESQIEQFNSIWTHDGLLTLNYRSVQPHNGRTIVIRGSTAGLPGGAGSISASAVFISVFVMVSFFKDKLQ